MFCEDYDKLVSNLEGRGFTVHSAAGGEEAKKLVLDLIGDRASVGCGGSMTISSLGLPDALRAQGKKYGLQTMCEGGGVANVTIIEAL